MGSGARANPWTPARGLALAMLLACAPAAMAAQPGFAFGWDPRTGDAVLDARLADINRYGDRYRAAFVDELVRYHAAPRALVTALLADEQWAPGDLYFACALAQAAGHGSRYARLPADRRWRGGQLPPMGSSVAAGRRGGAANGRRATAGGRSGR